MTLEVPLTLRVGDQHLTRQVQSLSFRKEAVGGCRSITFKLARPLDDLDGIDALAKVYVYDGNTGETVVDGRLADSGRGADGDGEFWDCVAFGPAQHASDNTMPLIYVDRDLNAWRARERTRQDVAFDQASKPDGSGVPGLLFTVEQGITIVTNDYADMIYTRIRDAGQKLGGISFDWDAGITAGDITVGTILSADGSHSPGGYNLGPTASWNTAGGTGLGADVVTNFANGRNTAEIRMTYGGAGGATSAGWWGFVNNIAVRALMYTKSGAEVTTGYRANVYTLAHDVVADLLGRPGLLGEYDGANAIIDTSSTYQIKQLAYDAAVTAAQVLDDLMAVVPGYRWYTTPDQGLGYGFRWETWPTRVRYEATLDDGGSFPLSAQGLYNVVGVRWTDEFGVTRTEVRTMACDVLDAAGLTRRAALDLGAEAGTQAQAQAAGDAFLADHNVPKNAGTLTVARPIRDVQTGALVQPWEIEAGELIRVRGVEGYTDALNADTNDGQTVFRIYALDYSSEGNASTLALDADPRTTADALVQLMRQRSRG